MANMTITYGKDITSSADSNYSTFIFEVRAGMQVDISYLAKALD